MTDLQVKFWTLQEAERANRAKEDIDRSKVKVDEYGNVIKEKSLSETERANRAQETLKEESNRLQQQTINNLKIVQDAEAALKKNQVTLNNAQINQINQAIKEMDARIQNIHANTRLTNTEKQFYQYKEIESVTKSISNLLSGAGSLSKLFV